MPVTKSAKKKLIQDRKREARNNKLRIFLKEKIKKAKKNPTETTIREAISISDKSAKARIVHKNKAARIKSSLAKLLKIGDKKIKSPKKSRSKKISYSSLTKV